MQPCNTHLNQHWSCLITHVNQIPAISVDQPSEVQTWDQEINVLLTMFTRYRIEPKRDKYLLCEHKHDEKRNHNNCQHDAAPVQIYSTHPIVAHSISLRDIGIQAS